MELFDKGSAIVTEVETKKLIPFGEMVYFTPTTIKIIIRDPNGTKQVDTDMTKATWTIGKYYYICQTDATWLSGVYSIEIDTSDGTNDDVTIEKSGFRIR